MEVAVPLAASVALVQLIVRPATEPATLTVPAKFCVLVRVNTSVVDAPLLKLRLEDAELTVKSPTWTVIVTECVAVPVAAVAVRVRLYTPGVDEDIVHVEVAVPLAARVPEVQLTVRPATEPATLTVLAKFCVLVRVRTSVVDEPVLKLRSDDAAATVKSPT